MWPFSRKDAAPPARKSASFYFSLSARKAGLSGAAYDKLASEGYAESVVAFACIGKLAAAVSSVEPQLYRKGKGGKLTKITDHPLLDLLESPNPAQSGPEFRAWLGLTDGTTVWTTIANADIETAPSATLDWGNTKVPFLTGTSDTASAAGAQIYFQYSGGTPATPHTTGSIKFSVCLEKVA